MNIFAVSNCPVQSAQFLDDMYWDGLTGSIRDLSDDERMHLREVRKAKEEEMSDEDYIKF